MPRSGRMNVEAFAAHAAREILGYKTEPWSLKGAQVLNLHYEIDNDTIDDLLPVTMRPSIPAWAVFNVTRYPDSPVGPFTIGEVRIGSRAGVRPRGFALRSYVDNDAAVLELAQRWGYPTVSGQVYLRIFHDRVVARVTNAAGKNVLDMEMIDREPADDGHQERARGLDAGGVGAMPSQEGVLCRIADITNLAYCDVTDTAGR